MDGWMMEYGFGMWFYVTKNREVNCYQKEGINAADTGAIRHFPKDDINVVILSNMEDGAWDPVWKVHELIVAD